MQRLRKAWISFSWEGAMPLIHLVMVLLAYGTVLWLVHTYVPAGGSIRIALSVLVVLAACVWAVRAFGLWTGF